MEHQKPATVKSLTVKEEIGLAVERNFAKVHYQREGSDGFLIVQFEAFKTGREIAEAYGMAACENYLKSAAWMRMEDDGNCLVTSVDGAMNGLRPGHVMDSETFTKVIGTIKKCGNSLGAAIRNSPKKPTIRVIEI